MDFIDDYKDEGEKIFDAWTNLGRLDALNASLATLSPDEILIAVDDAPYPRLVKIVDSCLASGCVVRVFSNRLKVLANRLGVSLDGVIVVVMLPIEAGQVV